MDLVNYILNATSWLYTKIYQNQFFFFDLWSFVHLWSGFAIYLVLSVIWPKRALLILVSILILYEIIEILFLYFAFMIFRPETIKDQFTDIFVGISGGFACIFFLRSIREFYDRYPRIIMTIIMFIVSSTYAFIWVGFYHYRYNVEIYNTPVINISTFFGWTLGGMFIIFIFRYFSKKRLIWRLGLTWLIYFLALLSFEYIFYYILEVREITGLPLKPMIFGLIHGTRTLHVFYLIAPFIILSLYSLCTFLINRSLGKEVITPAYSNS